MSARIWKSRRNKPRKNWQPAKKCRLAASALTVKAVQGAVPDGAAVAGLDALMQKLWDSYDPGSQVFAFS